MEVVKLSQGIPSAEYCPCLCLAHSDTHCSSVIVKACPSSEPQLLRETMMWKMWVERDFADATIVCEGKHLDVHRCVLCAASRVFDAAFKNEMKESQCKVLHITDAPASAVEAMLQHVYTGSIEDTNVAEVLPLAHKYELLALAEACVDAMIAELSEDSIARVVQQLQTYSESKWMSEALDKVLMTVQSDTALLRALARHVRTTPD